MLVNTLQDCDAVQHTATHCNTLQQSGIELKTLLDISRMQNTVSAIQGKTLLIIQITAVLQHVALCCNVLQCAAVCCSVLQCVAVCCSVLQCAAVCCSVLQCVARLLLHTSDHLQKVTDKKNTT